MRTICCVVLLLYGAVAYGFPQLTVVTDRALAPGHLFVYSASGSGFPAIQSNVPLMHGLINGTRLDDRCRLTKVRDIPIGVPLVSFTRQLIGWSGIPEGGGLVRYGPDNRRSLASPSPVGTHWLTSLADDGSFIDDHGMAYDAHGHPLILPKASDGQPMRVVKRVYSNDTRYLLVRAVAAAQATEGLFLYDTAKPWLYPMRIDIGMGTEGTFALYHDRSRVSIVPEHGRPATVVLQDREFTLYGSASPSWHIGEDGSQWRMANRQLTILRWRGAREPFPGNGEPQNIKGGTRARPYEERFPVRTAPNHYFRDDAYDNRPGWAAVWHDGDLVALTEMVAPHTRRLTLYRMGRPIRQYDVRITGFSKGKRGVNREHLAFTQDGRYLSWIVDTGKRTRVLVFRVR